MGALIPGADRDDRSAVIEIPVESIRPNARQPRGGVQEGPLAELADSIREQGILQPILVRSVADGYELIAGERRWRAARSAGLRTIPAVIREFDDRGALEAALVENLQREDLTALDRARAYSRLSQEFGISQETIARRVGRSQPSVANTVRLLSLPPEIQASLEAGRITEGHARAMLTVDDPTRMLALWRLVEKNGLSVRETESAAKRRLISREITAGRSVTNEISIIQQTLIEKLGAPVRIVHTPGGEGEIRIRFASADDLDRLLALIGGVP